MRVNIYAEEMPKTPRVELISKTVDGQVFTGIRIYLYLPVTMGAEQVAGPFIHHEGDDDSSAITFWGKHYTQATLEKALDLIKDFYAGREP
jgi:hypothetical protein